MKSFIGDRNGPTDVVDMDSLIITCIALRNLIQCGQQFSPSSLERVHPTLMEYCSA